MRHLYSFSVYALMLLLFLYFFMRSIHEPEYRHRWFERLGNVNIKTKGALWIHAASVGEVQAASPLIDEMLKREPGIRILLTTFTPTGSRLVLDKIRRQWGKNVDHCYLPLDTPTAVFRFLDRASPRKLLIVETEIWPNLLMACGQYEIPVILVSATLSEKSLHRYLAFPANKILPRAIINVGAVLAQSKLDAERFARLGVNKSQIHILGNLKFDFAPPENIFEEAKCLRSEWHALERPIWVAGSTHEGEEQMVLEAYKSLKAQIHDLLLVLVPRHPHRFDRANQLCNQAHVSMARLTKNDRIDDETEVVLADTVGDLIKYMAMADVTFVGGSLVPVGGHNLLEPAALQQCVISGPHTESQSQLRDLLIERDAFLEVSDARSLENAVKLLLDSPRNRAEKGLSALSVVKENQGVVRRILDFI